MKSRTALIALVTLSVPGTLASQSPAVARAAATITEAGVRRRVFLVAWVPASFKQIVVP